MSEFPWSKREIIDAVIAEFRPFNMDQILDLDIDNRQEVQALPYPTMLRAFMRVALGRPEGRASPVDEHALWQRCQRVYRALRDGRDPNAAYEVPMAGEIPLTAEEQMRSLTTPSCREFARQIDEIDREVRSARKGKRFRRYAPPDK